jgi:nucleotide-binding universal stress UspA family protein
VFVVHARELPLDFLGSPSDARILSERRDRGEALLREIAFESDALAGPEYETEPIGGAAAQSIADVARVRDADEIIAGARGVARMRALLGSVSHELLHVADRRVEVIPAAAVIPHS